MTPTTPAPPRRRLLADLTPLRRSPAFARLWAGTAIAGIGTQMTTVAVGLEVYEITRSTFAVALVGVIALVPMIVAGLYGGMLADAFDRRLVALVSSIIAWVAVALIATHAWLDLHSVLLLYVLATVNAVAATVSNASRSAIVPRLVGTDLLPAASALGGIASGFQVTVGPAIAGVLIATVGFAPTYTIDVVLFTFAFLGVFTLPRMAAEHGALRPGLGSLIEGAKFLRRSRNITMTFVLDIVAMTFGQPRVLFPAIGALVIGGGSITVGTLTAAYAIGALLSSVFSGPLGHVRRQGEAVGWAITAYGGAIAGFGVVIALAHVLGGRSGEAFGVEILPALGLAALFLAMAGGADNVSSVFRNTILQAASPDGMRGRLQGIFIVVVTGGPRLGDLYAGLVVAAGIAYPPVIGGVLIIGLVALLLRMVPSFRRYDALHPHAN
ncbi:MFS transporter [Curtobacterium aurantiacum]|uniref:MFS transporter n=1 Tax=Curtobacterium aurantiacum TaxID=3236919 RepID=UPI001BDFD0B1|nr:MFS transporter [Curtobacterium flaccumfaciens]MBT1676454.1 MFS transporter [Curtobacterium flaccumfaciens pv. flaccumfaciens]